MKRNTIALTLVVHYELGNIHPRKIFKVLRYVCIDYLGTEITKISQLKLGRSLKTRHEDKDYDKWFGIGIPDIFMNMLSCQVFLNNNDFIVILKCPNRMSQYYFNKGFIQLTCDEGHLKTSCKVQRQSWCRFESEYKLSHAMSYNHNFHFIYTEKLIYQ